MKNIRQIRLFIRHSMSYILYWVYKGYYWLSLFGGSFLKRLTTHIPVLAISANAMPRDIKKRLEAGFFRYLTKAIKINEFLEALDWALKLSKTRSARDTMEDRI